MKLWAVNSCCFHFGPGSLFANKTFPCLVSLTIINKHEKMSINVSDGWSSRARLKIRRQLTSFYCTSRIKNIPFNCLTAEMCTFMFPVLLFVLFSSVKSLSLRLSDQGFSSFFAPPPRHISLWVFKMQQKLLNTLCMQAAEFAWLGPKSTRTLLSISGIWRSTALGLCTKVQTI